MYLPLNQTTELSFSFFFVCINTHLKLIHSNLPSPFTRYTFLYLFHLMVICYYYWICRHIYMVVSWYQRQCLALTFKTHRHVVVLRYFMIITDELRWREKSLHVFCFCFYFYLLHLGDVNKTCHSFLVWGVFFFLLCDSRNQANVYVVFIIIVWRWKNEKRKEMKKRFWCAMCVIPKLTICLFCLSRKPIST